MPDSPRQPPLNHADIIGLWPSLGEFASDVGVSYGTAKQMRRRNSITDDHRPAVVAKAAERGFVGITFELLSLTAPRRTKSEAEGGPASPPNAHSVQAHWLVGAAISWAILTSVIAIVAHGVPS